MTPQAARIEALVAEAAIAVGPHGDHARTLGSWLDAGLAVARASEGMTFVALPAPVVPAAAVVTAVRGAPLVTWTTAGLTLVGEGAARELRGTGEARWSEVIAGARAIASGSDAPTTRAVIAGVTAPVSALEFARPRLVGGAAFAPGAAARAPWTGFGDAWFVLPRWTYVHDGARAFVVLAVDARDAAAGERWHAELEAFRAAFAAPHPPRVQPALVELQPGPEAEWRAQVTAITDAIERGEVSKIVAARTCRVMLAAPVRAADLLAALDERHADCMRVLIQPPGAGALVAATPERLVRREGELVECDALAGSIARTADDAAAAAAALLASAKDRVEHQLVVDAIRTALESADAEIVTGHEPPTVRALRHVIHLHTPFRATLRRPCHLLELAARLHPTPAVGGTPTDLASAWIQAHEPVPRGWYSSPVGWFDLDGNGELAVALRCGVIADQRAHLWAGAGIVAGSDPDRELAETDVKLRAMLGALGVSTPGERPGDRR